MKNGAVKEAASFDAKNNDDKEEEGDDDGKAEKDDSDAEEDDEEGHVCPESPAPRCCFNTGPVSEGERYDEGRGSPEDEGGGAEKALEAGEGKSENVEGEAEGEKPGYTGGGRDRAGLATRCKGTRRQKHTTGHKQEEQHEEHEVQRHHHQMKFEKEPTAQKENE